MRIPFAEIQTESPGSPAAPPQIDSSRIPAMAAAGAGAMAEVVGGALGKAAEVVDKFEQAREKAQISNATTDAAGQLGDLRLELEKEPDTSVRHTKFQAAAEQIRQAKLADMGGRAANEFNLRFNSLYKPMEMDVKQDARREEVTKFKVDLSDSLEKLANQSVMANSQLERETIQAEAEKQIQQAVNSGYLKAGDAASHKHAYLGKVDGALAAEQVRRDPQAAIDALGDAKNYPYLDAAQRVQLRTMATTRLESQNAQNKAEARIDAAEFTSTLKDAIATGTPIASEQEFQTVLQKVGPNSPQGIRLKHQWDLTTKAIALSAGKSPSEIQAQIATLERASTAPGISATLAGVQADVGKTLEGQGIDLAARITSSTRTEAQNAGIPGAAKDSQHLHGNALDIRLDGLTPEQRQGVIDKFLSDPRVKGFGWYADHIHIDTRPGSAVSWGLDGAPASVKERVSQWQSGAAGGQQAAADQALKLTPQERNLWLHHSDNLAEGGVARPGGKTSTLSITTAEFNGKTYLIPTIWDNKPLSEDEAIDRARQAGLDNFPSYASAAEARARYDALHLFLEKDLPPNQAPSADDLRTAHALHQIMAREILARDRDPNLHADVDQFIQVLSAATTGKPNADPTEFNKLVERAGGPDTPMGVRLTRAWRLASNVSADAAGTIPEIQARVDELRAGKPSAEQLAQANHLELILRHKEELRAADPKLRLDVNAFLETVKAGMTDGKLPSQQEYEQLLDRVGGPATATGTHLMRAWSDANGIAHDATSLSLPELAKTVNQLRQSDSSVADLEKSHALNVALRAKTEARDKDPAAYVAQSYPTVGETMARADAAAQSSDPVQQAQAADLRRTGWATMIDLERKDGVPENKIALLPKPAVEAIKGQLSTAQPQDRASLMEGLRTQYGDAWPYVQRQLWEGKATTPDLQVMGDLPNDDSGKVARQIVGEAFKFTDKQGEQQIGGERQKAINDEVRRQTAAMAATMAQAPDGPARIASYQEAIRKVAELNAIRGQANDRTAVKQAVATVFADHYQLADAVGGVAVRIPVLNGQPTVDPGDVSRVQKTVMNALPQMDLMTPSMPGVSDAQRKDAFVYAIRSNGYWMTTGGDQAMQLFAGPGIAVKFSDGSDVIVPFDSVAAAAGQRGASEAARLRILERGYQAGQEPEIGETKPGVYVPPPIIQHFLNPPLPPSASGPGVWPHR